MSISRRGFCAAGAISLSSSAILGSASAQSQIEVTGTIRSEVGADVAGVEFQLENVSNPEVQSIIAVDSSGEINLTLPETGAHRATIFNKSAEIDRIPVIYSFDNVNVGEDGNIGEFVIPEAYYTNIRFVSEDGDPIESLPITFGAENDTFLGPSSFTTNADGYIKYPGATERGVELSSPTKVAIQPPSTPIQEAQRVQTVFVTRPTQYEFEISNPEQYSATATSDSPSGSDGSDQRGLFSNNPSGRSGPLTDPTNLTTLGFLLSVGGIAYQLVGGR